MGSILLSRAATFAFLAFLALGHEGRPSIGTAAAQETAQGQSAGEANLLSREAAGKLLPATVFFRGKVAPIQARNSAGVRLPGSRLILATLVDTSGYASSVQEVYQAYLIAESPLRIGEKSLPAGAYGFGFVSGDEMVVMDVGGTEVLRTGTTRDAAMTRPNPLQMVADGVGGGSTGGRYRLYLGRSFVLIEAARTAR